MLSRFGPKPIGAVLVMAAVVAFTSFAWMPSNIFGIGRPHHSELRVRLVAHRIPDYDAWLAANGPYFEPGAAAAYPPEYGMYAHREVFFLSPAKDTMFYILFFEPAGEAAIREAYSPNSDAWKMAEDAGILLQPVLVKHMDAKELFPAEQVSLPKPGETFEQPKAWPEALPSIDQATIVFDCRINVKTGEYECL